MFQPYRGTSFWVQPWFLVFAIVAGEVYGGWWMSLGAATPRYVPAATMVVASVADGFDVTITAPILPGAHALIQATN